MLDKRKFLSLLAIVFAAPAVFGSAIPIVRLGARSARPAGEAVSVYDDFESYTDGVDLDTLNAGTNWAAAYRSDGAPAPANDDFESYSDGASLDTLNGGTNWTAAYRSA